jgi:hypothetical protein
VFGGVDAGSGANVAHLSPTALSLTQSGHGQFTIQPSQGIVFPDATIQTTAFPGFTGYAPLASPAFTGNPTAPTPATSDNDTSIATTAYVKAQDFGDRYLTSSTTSNTIGNGNKTFTIGTGLSYTPTQNLTISYDASNHMHGEVLTYSTSTGVLTVDINHHTGSGTYAAWVVNVGGVTPATSVAFSDITGAVSGNVNLQAALDLKANLASPSLTGVPLSTTAAVDTNTTQIATTAYVVGNGYAKLASPTFTGTPTLPTGTIGVTQSPGNNTTALATTAFVTAAVPAFATVPQSINPTSTTTVNSPRGTKLSSLSTNLWAPGVSALSTATSGTGANASSTVSSLNATLIAPNVGIAGYATRGFTLGLTSNSSGTVHNFSTESGHNTKVYSNAWGSTLTAVKIRGVFGRTSLSSVGNLAIKGYGWEWDWSARVMSIIAHNGTTLTTTALTTAFVPASGRSYEISALSDGAGNISVYIDGTLMGTTTGGPTGYSASNFIYWQQEIENTSASAPGGSSCHISNPKVFTTNG